jgi:release factor glutamine methyltransferase
VSEAAAAPVPAPRVVREALAWGGGVLAAAGCASPRLDAELLLADALGVTRAQLVTGDRSEVGALDGDRYQALIARRAEREPVAYILGVKGFRRIELHIDRRVLIPRPETELLVEVGLELAHGARVADVGTGSGAVALALKDERPDLDITGIEISEGALALARENAARLGLSVDFIAGDLLSGAGDFDAVLANLPYVEHGSTLAPEIEQYEPAVALFGGDDGLDLIRRMIAMAGAIPLLALEIGNGRADAVSELLSQAGFGELARLPDLAGIERVVVGRR